IMIRDSLAANAKHASLFATPLNGVSFIRRASTGGGSTSTSNAGIKAPVWVKLVRKGTTITSYRSTNGVTWTQVDSTTVNLGSTVYVGLAVSSHNTSALNTATFDTVSIVK
ncbi:MAG: cellulose 1,4-beta-cellobiosidase, partial [Tepidisphaeraceae bacterium]